MASLVGNKRILVLTSTFPRWENDTSPAFVFDLCKCLVQQGYKVDVLAPHSSGANTYEILEDVCVYRYRYCLEDLQTLAYDGGIVANLKQQKWRYLLIPLFLASQLIHTIRCMRRTNYDLIHAHWIIPQGFIAALASGLTGAGRVPLLVTSHGSDFFAFNTSLFRQIKQWTLNKMDCLVVVSNFMKARYQQAFNDTGDIQVCSMGVDLTRQFVPAARSTQSDNRLIFVGRLVENKGVTYLLVAFHILCEQGLDIYLDIVGDGPEMTKLLTMVNQLKLEKRVTLHGAIPNTQLPGFYHRASIAVVPSIIADNDGQEGLGLTTIEAMGCECAVVASSLDAFSEVIVDGETGLLCPPSDAVALADKIKLLLDDREQRQQLAQAGRQRVLGLYDWQHISHRYSQLYENTINSLHDTD